MAKTRLNVLQLSTLNNNDLATDKEVEDPIDDHTGDINPHPQYLTPSWDLVKNKPSVQCIQLAGISGTSIIPYDNTTPLITEGSLIATASFTPVSVNSKLIINGTLSVNCGTGNRNLILSVFKGTTCIGVTTLNFISSTRPQIFSFNISDLNMGSGGIVNTITYTLRYGVSASATWYINKMATAVFNNLLNSNSITFMEYV